MKSKLEAAFDNHYDANSDPWNYWSSKYERDKYSELIEHVGNATSPSAILEIGCSSGAHTELIAKAFPDARITGLDISETAISRAPQRLKSNKNIELIHTDIFEFVRESGLQKFDVVFWSEGFDYLHAHSSISEFSELARALNGLMMPDGVLCISHIVPNPLSFSPWDAGTRNTEVFHALLKDFFFRRASFVNKGWKEETENIYRYETKLYQPKALGKYRDAAHRPEIDKVEVVIPARDEAPTIASVVEACLASAHVESVIVVDNDSSDQTRKIAEKAGALVVPCTPRGYGRALKVGLKATTRPWIIKLDADIRNFSDEWIDSLVECAKRNGVSLVKACWAPSIADPDRVTNFTVKPALRIFFPELSKLRSPLSGVYLFDRHVVDFAAMPNGFAFDIAMLIEASRLGHRILETQIETVRHASVQDGTRTYQHYMNMSDELLRHIVEAGIARFQ